MLKVYLDNNIIANVEEAVYSVNDIYNMLGTDQVEFYYSDNHVRETHPLLYTDKLLGKKRMLNRLMLISKITNNKLLAFDTDGNVITVNVFPLMRHYQINDFATEEMVNAGFQDNMPFAFRELYKKVFDFLPKELNNISIDKIIDVLDRKYIARQSIAGDGYQKKWGTSLKDLEQEYFKEMGGNPSMYDKIAAIFLLLDLCGYWKDKETDRSDFARMYDSCHATMATHCDYFITNDKKNRMKTQVAYHYLNTCYDACIKTQVIEFNTSHSK